MDSTRFINEVKDGKITFQTLRNVNKSAYVDFVNRILCFACLDTVIKNCEYLLFEDGQIKDSRIKIKYLLLKGIDDKYIHLGIDSYKENRPYFARTLLITEGNNSKKFIDKADEKIRISKLDIINKKTNKIELSIDRKKAYDLAKDIIKDITQKWFKNEFKMILTEYYEDKNNIVINRSQKDKWKKMLSVILESKKQEIKNQIDKYDSYWANKIVAESIRDYIKNISKEDIEKNATSIFDNLCKSNYN